MEKLSLLNIKVGDKVSEGDLILILENTSGGVKKRGIQKKKLKKGRKNYKSKSR